MGETKLLQSDLITNKYTEVLYEESYKFNAPHHFKVFNTNTHKELADVHFQEGAINEYGINGVANEDLIAMVIKRLECFQESPFKCQENQMAIIKLQESLMWLRKRTTAREQRNVEGTHNI